MATFQIHEDVENYFPKIQCRNAIGSTRNANHIIKNDMACNGKENVRHVLKPIMKNVCNNEQKCSKFDDSICVIEQTEKDFAVIPEIEEDHKTSCLDSAVVKVGKPEVQFTKRDEKDGFPTVLSQVDEYRKDILQYYMQAERECDEFQCLPAQQQMDYMRRQPELTWGMRRVLVDWLAAVSDEYQLHPETLHLAVGYVDRFLRRVSVVREKFQLVGAAAMMVAAKVEEIYPPDTAEWAYLTGDAYSVRQLLKMEQLVLRALGFRVQPPTQLTFVRHLCVEHRLDERTMHLAMYVSELVLEEGEAYLGQPPSALAAAAVAYARFTLRHARPWPPALSASSGYRLRQLSPVVRRQHRTHSDSPLRDTQAIRNKYKAERYHRVALLEPRTLDLDALDD